MILQLSYRNFYKSTLNSLERRNYVIYSISTTLPKKRELYLAGLKEQYVAKA